MTAICVNKKANSLPTKVIYYLLLHVIHLRCIIFYSTFVMFNFSQKINDIQTKIQPHNILFRSKKDTLSLTDSVVLWYISISTHTNKINVITQPWDTGVFLYSTSIWTFLPCSFCVSRYFIFFVFLKVNLWPWRLNNSAPCERTKIIDRYSSHNKYII